MCKKNDIDFQLSIKDTMVLKCIAICAMLVHHVITCVPPEIEIQFDYLSIKIGVLGKVCVAMFLYLSGYGLTLQFSKLIESGKITLKKICVFILKRFVKFYSSYWPIFILFVPIGIFAFGRPLTASYGEHVNLLKRLIYDVIGIGGFGSYNITWWFNKLIVLLYLFFPVFYFIVRRLPAYIVFAISGLFAIYGKLGFGVDWSFWQFSFVLGMLMAYHGKAITNFIQRFSIRLVGTAVLMALLVLIYLRLYAFIPVFYGVRVDPFIALVLAFAIPIFCRNVLQLAMGFVGKHATNVYMIHTFIYCYWFASYVYRLHYALLISLGLLMVCVVVSLGIEYLKEKVGINKLVVFIIDRLNRIM